MTERPDEIEITPSEVEEALRCPERYLQDGRPFVTDDPTLFRTWALGPVFMESDGEHVTQVEEGAELFFHLRKFPDLAREWQGIRMERHGRWWDHITYRVLDDEGVPTRVFRVVTAWRRARGS